jgi:3-oxoadipate enol-lactonase
MTATVTRAEVRTDWIGPAPRLCFDEAGDGPALIFLHGVGGHRGNWRDQVARFGAAGLRAIAPDLRGYGDSDDDDGAVRAFTDFADDVVRLLDTLSIARATICGLSMGGRIALDLWRRHPDRIERLVLADTSAGSKETQDPAKVEAFLAARRKPLLDGLTTAELAPTLVETLIGPNATREQRRTLTASLAALHRDAYLKTLEAVTRFTDFPDFGSIAVPTLVIVGSEDRIAPPHIARAMAEAIPGAVLEVLDGAGHISNIEAPAAFDAALARFLGVRL